MIEDDLNVNLNIGRKFKKILDDNDAFHKWKYNTNKNIYSRIENCSTKIKRNHTIRHIKLKYIVDVERCVCNNDFSNFIFTCFDIEETPEGSKFWIDLIEQKP